MSGERFETMLSGGHPNSLGKTVEVTELVLTDKQRLEELFSCYFSPDEVVRLRTSSALKRVAKVYPEWLVPHLEGLLSDVAAIEQASTKWTLAELFEALTPYMTEAQKARATDILKTNLSTQHDWIVLINTAQTLAGWAQRDTVLKAWLTPQLSRLTGDKRKSVARAASKYLKLLS